ncbi:hypothetical protein L6164_037266 [Bauhinia variegata]|uniref:Uncharacterized protein n=1 Tax=Bauhinia variegata TaxID=167791 RepID=A0ACB9KJQ7_BAUVA|nr:hypothetical protein L6164_037266 [Bauhinia variegata]
MSCCRIFKPLIIALIFFFVGITNIAKAEVVLPCLDNLSACDNYLGFTNPPAICCNAILETEANQLPCLCQLFSNPVIFETAGVNYTEALQLFHNCGVTTDLTNCNGSSSSDDQQPCADKLDVCVRYFGSPNPAASCCNAIKQAEATQLPCLCNMFSSPQAFENAGLNYTEAVQLTHYCGITTDVTTCKAIPGNNTAGSGKGNGQGGLGKGNDRGDSSKVTWTRLYFLLLFLASMLFN